MNNRSKAKETSGITQEVYQQVHNDVLKATLKGIEDVQFKRIIKDKEAMYYLGNSLDKGEKG